MSEPKFPDGDVLYPDRPGDGIDLLTRPETKPKTKKPSMYNVVMLNDDYTPMDFVVSVLQKIFHKSLPDAQFTMLQIHLTGKGIAGTYNYEVAETKQVETMNLAKRAEYPLKLILEKV